MKLKGVSPCHFGGVAVGFSRLCQTHIRLDSRLLARMTAGGFFFFLSGEKPASTLVITVLLMLHQ